MASIALIEVGFDEKAVHMGVIGLAHHYSARAELPVTSQDDATVKKKRENRPQRIIRGRTKIMLKTGERRKKKEQKS